MEIWSRDPEDRLIQNAARLILVLIILRAAAGTILHLFQPHPGTIELILAPTMLLIFSGLFIALLRYPRQLPLIIKIMYFCTVFALAVPSWFYSIQAYRDSSFILIETYPPLTPSLFTLFIIAMILFQPRVAFRLALMAWLLIAVPVLSYLFTHQQELWTPRGEDMMMMFGPALLLVLIVIPFYREMQFKIQHLSARHDDMQALAELDVLTNLPNRRSIHRLLNDILTTQTPAGLLLFDLDHFKHVNDQYGHTVGDQVLKSIADRCRKILRKDGYIARWGGEEFIVVLKFINKDELLNIAERLRHELKVENIDPVGKVTASFGATMVVGNDSEISLLTRVDDALYKAKDNGRDCVVYQQ